MHLDTLENCFNFNQTQLYKKYFKISSKKECFLHLKKFAINL